MSKQINHNGHLLVEVPKEAEDPYVSYKYTHIRYDTPGCEEPYRIDLPAGQWQLIADSDTCHDYDETLRSHNIERCIILKLVKTGK